MSGNVIQFPNAAQGQGQGPGGGSGSSGGTPTAPPDPYLWARQQVWAIRYNRKFNDDQKRRILHNFISNHENRKTTRGAAFLRTRDHRAYLFDGRRCKLYRIEPDDPEFCAYLWEVYGLNSSEGVTKHVIASLKNGTIAQGLLRDVRRFAYYDKVEQKLYISRYDGTCYQIDGEEVIIKANGHGPAVFLDDDQGVSCDEPIVGNHRVLLKNLVDDLQYAPTTGTGGGMSPEIQKTCLAIWMFTIAFPELMPAKPLLLVEGEKGSGKTLALQRIAIALHGKHMPLSIAKKEDPDFGVKILRSPIAIIDDVNEPVDWLRDTLCTYCTGGGWTRRKLFTDDSESTIKPQSFLAITTNNPTTFRQGQVADRCLIIRLERREDQAGYIAADSLFDTVRRDREEIFGEWLFWLNEIVFELKKGQVAIASKYRMADFAHLAHVIGKVLAQPGGPPGNWSPSAIEEMLEGMQAERDALVIEGDTLPDVIDKWLETSSNQGREVRIADLYRELGIIAKTLGVSFYRSPKTLASRLRDAGGPLGHHFLITRRAGHGGVMVYTFRRT